MKVCPPCKLKYPNDSTACFLCGGPLSALQDPLIGTTIAGRYLIEEAIGEGGMATVYSARHRLVDRPCAVKVMNPALGNNEVIRERFRREAKAAQKLAHPNIIEIFDQGETPEGSLYLVMEILQGQTVADLLERQGSVPLDRTLSIAIQIARALARAHDLEVIHRDLKPENIFLAEGSDGFDRVKLLDFGIARSMQDTRLTGAGEVFGTPQYMAPERITSIDAGPGADLYALGVILYEMLCGVLPFDAPDVTTYFIKHLKEMPPPPRKRDPSIPAQLDQLIMEMLAKDPKDRPVDAHRVHADLLGIAGTIGVRVPGEAFNEEASSRGPAKTLPPVAIDQWVKRTAVFERMLNKAYVGGRPTEVEHLFNEVKRLVREIGELRAKAISEQRTLESIESRGRETRQRFGHAVDALGVDASKARDELKAALSRVTAAQTALAQPREQMKSTMAEILRWEGRSGLQEPYRELAAAYRSAADLVDDWLVRKAQAQAADREAAQRKTEVDDLEFQIKELRAALAAHSEGQEREDENFQRGVSEAGKRADELDRELLEMASRLCAPLRLRPELSDLFHELEEDAAA
ncbi:MAG: serine/threonine protein kinase [Polyangiaceae bacterium]|nr:serine/threonine protein kinase [Polyangiaceae bacterium]